MITPLHTENQARLRERLTYLFILALLGLILLGGWLTFRFAMPQESPWVTVDALERLPPRAEPYWFSNNEVSFYLLNDGEKLFAIYPRTNSILPCFVTWEAGRQRFVDPCLGALYSPYGDYAFYGPPPYRSLDRIPVQVTAAGDIQVHRDVIVEGRTPDEITHLCRQHQSGHRFIPPQSTMDLARYADECDFRGVAYASE